MAAIFLLICAFALISMIFGLYNKHGLLSWSGDENVVQPWFNLFYVLFHQKYSDLIPPHTLCGNRAWGTSVQIISWDSKNTLKAFPTLILQCLRYSVEPTAFISRRSFFSIFVKHGNMDCQVSDSGSASCLTFFPILMLFLSKIFSPELLN